MIRQINNEGRITIPSEFRNELGLNIGDDVNIECSNGCITITNPKRDDLKQVIIEKLQNNDDVNEVIELIKSL